MTNTALWRQRVMDWRASGLSAADFCADEGLAASTLYQWAARLRRLDEERAEHRDDDSDGGELGETSPRLLRVVRNGSVATAPIEIVVAGALVRVRDGVAPAALQVVLDALDRRGAR